MEPINWSLSSTRNENHNTEQDTKEVKFQANPYGNKTMYWNIDWEMTEISETNMSDERPIDNWTGFDYLTVENEVTEDTTALDAESTLEVLKFKNNQFFVTNEVPMGRFENFTSESPQVSVNKEDTLLTKHDKMMSNMETKYGHFLSKQELSDIAQAKLMTTTSSKPMAALDERMNGFQQKHIRYKREVIGNYKEEVLFDNPDLEYKKVEVMTLVATRYGRWTSTVKKSMEMTEPNEVTLLQIRNPFEVLIDM